MTALQPYRGILHDTARNAPGQQYWHSGQDAFGAYFPGLDVGPVWDWDGDGVANAEPALTLTRPVDPPAGDGPDNPIIEPPGPPPPEMRVMEVDPPLGGDNPGDGDEGNPGDDDGEDGDETGGNETGDETGGDETGGDETGGDETGEDKTGGDDAFEGGITGELIIDAGSDTVPIKDDETGGEAFEGGITGLIEQANAKPEDPNGLNRDYIPNPPVDPPDGEDGEDGDGEDGEATRPNKAYKIDDAPGLESPEFALNFDNDSDDFDRDDPTPHVAIPIKIKEKTALPNKKGKIEIRKDGDAYLIGLWLSDEDYGLYRPTGLPESFGQLLDLSQEEINNIWGA